MSWVEGSVMAISGEAKRAAVPSAHRLLRGSSQAGGLAVRSIAGVVCRMLSKVPERARSCMEA